MGSDEHREPHLIITDRGARVPPKVKVRTPREDQGNPQHRVDRCPSKICPESAFNPGSPGGAVRVPLFFSVCHWSQGGEGLVRGGWAHISIERVSGTVRSQGGDKGNIYT